MMIRDAEPADAMAIAMIQIASWQAAYKGIVPQAYLDEMPRGIVQRSRFWEKTISVSQCRVLVAEDAEAGVIGWASGGVGRDENAKEATELYAIYICPKRWSKGVGKLLMSVLGKELERTSRSLVWVLKENARAIDFYRKVGYAEDGATKVIRLGGVELIELRMVKNHTLTGTD